MISQAHQVQMNGFFIGCDDHYIKKVIKLTAKAKYKDKTKIK